MNLASLIRPRRAALVALASLGALALLACGGGGDDDGGGGTARVRLINLTSDIASLDLYTERDSNTAQRNANVAADTIASYADLDATSYNLQVRRSGSDTTLLLQAGRTLASGTGYTLIAYGYDGAYKSALMSDNDAAGDSGKAKLRVFSTANDAGLLDVYLTDANTPLSGATANFSGLGSGAFTGFLQVTQGTYRLRITAAGDKNDVRLDLPSVALGNQQVVTLILTPGQGGVLVHGYLIPQGGALTLAKNSSVRARVVASIPGNGAVSVSAGGTVLASGLRSPTLGSYVLVPSSGLPLDVSVNGTAVGAPALAAAGGSDVTVLVGGTSGAEQVQLIQDDNRLPSVSTRAKVRVVNGIAGDTGGLTMTLNFSAIATGIAFGTASDPVSVVGGSNQLLEVTSPLSANPLFSTDDLTLAAQGVYTVFLLSGQTNPAGVLRRER
jgi:hypothetical protein